MSHFGLSLASRAQKTYSNPVRIAIALALSAALAACGGEARANPDGASGRGGQAASKKGPARGPREVPVARPVASPHARTLSLAGTLEARDVVDVAARVEGPVTFVGVELGDSVQRNQALARIAAEDFSARRTQYDAELAQADADLARLEQLAQSQMATPQSLEQARTRIAVLRTQRSLAGRQLRDTTVRAPFAGAIARRDVSVGAFVRIGSPLFQIVSTDDLRLVVEVPERYAPVVAIGTAMRVQHGETPIEARIARVAPIIASTTRTFRVEADVASGGPLRSGQFVTVDLDVGVERESVRVPRSALVHVLGRDRAMIVVDGAAQPREVELIAEEGPDAIVLGLTPADTIIANGVAAIAPGTRVTPREAARAHDENAGALRAPEDTARPAPGDTALRAPEDTARPAPGETARRREP